MEKIKKKQKVEHNLSNKDNVFIKLICISCKKQLEINVEHKCEYRYLSDILITSLK